VSLSGSPTWAPLFAGPPPPASLLPTVIYDPVRDRLLVFGGSGPGPVFYNDVWQLTLSGTRAWSLVATAGTRPAGRYAHRALYDPVRDRMVVYGGENGSTKFTDLWALTLSGTPTWTQLQAVGKPPAPHLPGAVYDPVADRAVFYVGNDWIGFSGGYNGDPSHRTTSLALKFDPPLWIDLPTTNPPPPTNPPPLNWQAIVYDPDVPRILMASGWQDNQILPVDTYALDLSEGLSLDLDVNDATMGAVTQEPSSCHAAGDKVVVEAVARPGYEFVEWLGDLSGNANPASITMDGYKSVLARFREVSVATLMTVFEAVPVEHGIEIRWQFGTPGDVASVSVERALQLEGPWTRVEAAQTSRGDLMVAMDRGASTGTTYFYRLVLDLRQGGQTTAGPVASVAAAPLISDLTLLSPNPTRGGVDVDFAVARGGVVRISVLDIAGRERAVLARGTYPAGLHALRWDGRIGGAKAAAGIYFMRFEGPGQTRVKRLVML